MNAVVRQGDTVLRIAGPWTPTVHHYLEYLLFAGIDWAPRALGIEHDRERLSFVKGEVPVYPLPDWVWSETVLEEGARRLRELHDASIGFGFDGAVRQAPAKVPAEVICHNDFAPHSLAFTDGKIVGAIDFDMCSASLLSDSMIWLRCRSRRLMSSGNRTFMTRLKNMNVTRIFFARSWMMSAAPDRLSRKL